MTDANTYKVILILEDGSAGECGAVDYEGAVWLVPSWLPFPKEGYAKPERMIRLDQFQHRRFDPPATGPGAFRGANFAVNDPLPKTLLSGELSPQLKNRYVVLERPDIKFRTGGIRH